MRTTRSMTGMRALLFLLLLFSAALRAETLGGRISAIVTGDSLTLTDAAGHAHRIRLSGIDAPENAQKFGAQSRTALSALAFSQPATAQCRERQREARQVCVVRVGERDLGLEQLRAGMAWWDQLHATEQTDGERADYRQAEVNAKLHRLGLWTGRNPQAPWAWRHGQAESE